MKEYNVKIHGEYYPSPLKVDTYKRNGDTYEVLYYLTKRHIVFMPIMDGQATQVVLKNGKVTEVKQNPGI